MDSFGGFTVILVLLFGSLAICSGSHSTSESTGPSIETSRKQRDYNSGYSYSNGEYATNNGYQYKAPNNADGGYHYQSPSGSPSQYVNSNTNAHYNSGGFSASVGQEQSSNGGYHYEAPSAYDYFSSSKPESNEMGYNYYKPSYSTSSNSNFKGNQYLPGGHSATQNVYHGQMNGYHYDSPQNSGYNYYKPQQSSAFASNFQGQSYLPKPTTPLPSQGYSYEKPSTVFKGDPYLPLPSVPSGW